MICVCPARDKLEVRDPPTHNFTDPGGFYSGHQFEVYIDKREFTTVAYKQAFGLFARLVSKDHKRGSLAGGGSGPLKNRTNHLCQRVPHEVPELLIEVHG